MTGVESAKSFNLRRAAAMSGPSGPTTSSSIAVVMHKLIVEEEIHVSVAELMPGLYGPVLLPTRLRRIAGHAKENVLCTCNRK